MLFLNSKPFAVYIARFWSITLSSLANNSLNFITFGCLQYYDLIYLFLSSVYNEHSNIKWYSSSSLLHIVHFLSDMGMLAGLCHLPDSTCSLWEDIFNLDVAFLYFVIVNISRYGWNFKFANSLYVFALEDEFMSS